MQSILTEFFHIQSEELSCGEKYKNANTKLADNDEYVTKALKDNPVLLAHYNAVTDALDEYDAIAVKDFYDMGFKAGFALAMEIFDVKINECP